MNGVLFAARGLPRNVRCSACVNPRLQLRNITNETGQAIARGCINATGNERILELTVIVFCLKSANMLALSGWETSFGADL